MKSLRRNPQRLLILGSGLPAERIAKVVEKAGLRYEIVGFVDDQPKAPGLCAQCARRVVGHVSDLQHLVNNTLPDRIVIALSERRGKLPVRDCLNFRMRGIVVEDWVDLYERITGKVAIESMGPGSFLFSKVFEPKKLQAMLLRSLDMVYALVGLVLTAPLMAVIAAAIKLDSEGPVLFVHRRMGYRGRGFDLLKFRTMTPATETRSEWVRDNDARVTRVGKILRKYRLDELPQFVNILAGQMSLVGPRPHPVTNAGLFFDEIPYYLIRSKVRPGVTGWAQIRFGYANDLDEETEKMRYDLYYIKHQSVFFDLQILFETIWIVLFGRGSEQTTERSDYAISQNNQREHEYGWQTTYKSAHVDVAAVNSPVSPSGASRAAFSLPSLNPSKFSSNLDPAPAGLLDANRAEPINAVFAPQPSNGNHERSNGSYDEYSRVAAQPSWLYRIADPTDLSFYSTAERRMIANEIRDQLGYEPLTESRNRRRLDNNPWAPWELRADKYRIFYEAEEDSREVTVVAVGHKEDGRLFLRGEEVLL